VWGHFQCLCSKSRRKIVAVRSISTIEQPEKTGPPMNMHDEESAVALRYVQGELAGQELTEFSRHLTTCRECKARVEEEIALSELFRKTSPLYRAPEDLRNRVAALVNQTALNLQPVSEVQSPIKQILKAKAWRWDTWRWFSLVAATVVLTIGVTISLGFFREFGAQIPQVSQFLRIVEQQIVAHAKFPSRCRRPWKSPERCRKRSAPGPDRSSTWLPHET